MKHGGGTFRWSRKAEVRSRRSAREMTLAFLLLLGAACLVGVCADRRAATPSLPTEVVTPQGAEYDAQRDRGVGWPRREILPDRNYGDPWAGQQSTSAGVPLASESPPFVLHGTVQDASGQAIVHAFVWVSLSHWRAEVIADADGRYETHLPMSIDEAVVRVVAFQSGFRPRRAEATVSSADPTGRIRLDVRLDTGRCLQGRAVAAGVPATGARVHGMLLGKPLGNTLTWTDSSGWFVLGCALEDSFERIVINHGELGSAERALDAGQMAAALGDVQLHATDPLVGRIVTSDGRGRSGISVRLVHTHDSVRDPARGAAVWNCTTDEVGAFRLFGMRDGTYHVYFPSLMDEALWHAPPQISKSPIEQRIELDAVMVVIQPMDNGVALSESSVRASWVAADAVGDEEAAKTWNRLEPVLARMVPRDSAWCVRVETPDGSKRAECTIRVHQEERVEQQMHLR